MLSYLKIEKWLTTYDHIDQQFSSHKTFKSWLRIDMREVKQTLLNECCKWCHRFQQHLVHHLTDSLQELQTFIENGMDIFARNVKMNDFEVLLSIMSVINQIGQREPHVETVFFEPLKDEVILLKNYNVELDDSILMKVQ